MRWRDVYTIKFLRYMSPFGGGARRAEEEFSTQTQNSSPLIPLQRGTAFSKILIKSLALFSILLIWNSLPAQSWNNFQTLGNEGSDGIDLIAPLPDGDFIAAGTFTESIELGNETFTAQGRQDLWLAKFDEAGIVEWAIQGGSPQEDVNADLKVKDGSIYWAGTFWQTGQLSLIHI